MYCRGCFKTLFAFLVFISCDTALSIEDSVLQDIPFRMVEVDGQSGQYPKEVDYPVVPEDHPALVCMRKKAHQMADIRWIPLKDIPGLTKPIPAGIERVGLPYSSVKEKDKFVGQEVSFHTFMTALHNPRSVLYTEDVKEPPYHGTNCGPYYGTVCSGAVNYALGIDRPYESSMYESLPYIVKVKAQSPEGLCPGDILWSEGHVVLLIDIKKGEDGKLLEFTILESAGSTTIQSLSLDAIKNRWESVGWVAYRDMRLAENLNYTPNPYVINEGDPVGLVASFNKDICTSRGDMVTYLEGEEVVINILNPSYKTMEIAKDGFPFKTMTVAAEDITLHSLKAGSYSVHLRSDNSVSKDVFFEIINERTSVRRTGLNYEVSFGSSNGIPVYLVVCTRPGARKGIVDITPYDLSVGGLLLNGNYRGMYLKVFYQGSYGKISNEPIEL